MNGGVPLTADQLWKGIMLAAAGVAAAAWLIAGHQAAEAGHTLGEKHCLSSPRTCLELYSPDGVNLIARWKSIRIRNFRDGTFWDATYEQALDTAEYAWANAVGPQTPSEPIVVFPEPLNITCCVDNRYLNCPDQGDPAATCFIAGAYVCERDTAHRRVCDNQAINITESETYIWNDFFSAWSGPKASIMAHEFGHTLGLWHHNSSSCLMQQGTSLTAPQPCDLGSADPFYGQHAPCDGSSDNYGIRCIYDWWREQSPAQDCRDPDRSGYVRTADITLAQAAYGWPAGEPKYHPDTDYNHSGMTTSADIAAIVQQYGQACQPPEHYANS